MCKEREGISCTCFLPKVVTWNVATMFPGEDANLASLLGDHKGKPDILMLALQEVKSQPQNLVAGGRVASRIEERFMGVSFR